LNKIKDFWPLNPWRIVIFCQEQLDVFKAVMDARPSPFIAYLDATGSLIQPHGHKRIYLYSLSAYINIEGIKALPLLEWISDNHSAKTISDTISFWCEKNEAEDFCPDIVTTDFSLAMMNAVASSFNKKTLNNQIACQWLLMQNEKRTNCNITILRLCANHLMHMVARRMRLLNVPKKVCFHYIYEVK